MFIDRRKRKLVRFKLAKTVETTPHAKNRQNYIKNIERAMIISLLIAIIFARIQLKSNINRARFSYAQSSTFEVVNIPELEEELPPPPEIKDPPMEETLIVDEIEIIEDTVEIELELAFEEPELLELDSQIEDKLSTKVSSYRDWSLDRSGLSLSAKSRDIPILDDIPLAFESKNTSYARDMGGSDEKLDLNISEEPEVIPFDTEDIDEMSQGSIIETRNDMDAVILRPPKSTLALKEYRLWHKLSTEMDRIDKGRAGASLTNIKRSRSGIKIHFAYSDGTKHTISWQKGGKTSILVIGKQRRTSIEELRRALNALLQITLK